MALHDLLLSLCCLLQLIQEHKQLIEGVLQAMDQARQETRVARAVAAASAAALGTAQAGKLVAEQAASRTLQEMEQERTANHQLTQMMLALSAEAEAAFGLLGHQLDDVTHQLALLEVS